MRLIDADLLKKNCKCTGKFEDNFKGVDLIELAKVIDAQPTAYDISKVVAELETLKIDKCNYFGVLNVVAEKYDRANEMLDDAIEIVNELAEEYQSRVMIDEQFCWQTCVCTDRCNECNRLADGEFDYYESIGEWEEEYINTSNDASEQKQPTWQQQTMNRFERVE